MTRRQIAEIQLEALLNEPELSSPAVPIRGMGDIMKNDKRLTIEKVSEMLSTQPCIIERLLQTLKISAEGGNSPTLSNRDVRKVTRVLNSTIDVRTLLLFNILGDNDPSYVTKEKLTQFFQQYLNKISTFTQGQLPEVLGVLLHKFHLNTVEYFDQAISF